MRLTLRCVACIALVSTVGAGCFGRANPRLNERTRTAGTIETTETFSYDENGRPSKVVDAQSGSENVTEFEWDGSLLTKITRTFDGGDANTTTLTYEGDRLVKAATDPSSGDVATTTIEYDGNNRFSKLLTESGTSTEEQTLVYDDSGRLSARNITYVDTVDEEQQTTTETTELAYQDGNLSKVTFDPEGDDEDLSIDLAYEGGRLASVTTNLSGFVNGATEPQDVAIKGQLTYDDQGRIVQIFSVADVDGVPEDKVEYSYEDGAAVDFDVTPQDLPLFLFDLKGTPFTSHDVHTQAARLLGF
jgi:YD repeat-containing protein